MKFSKILTPAILLLILGIVAADFGVNLLENKKVSSKLSKFKKTKRKTDGHFSVGSTNKEWANKILKGGYIIYIRHTQRDKSWEGGGIYDLLESDIHNNGINGTRFAENDYFSGPVCLTKKGKVQAQAIGEHFQKLKFPVGKVISSPICRARQTAEIIFGKYDQIDRTLVHSGVHSEKADTRYQNLLDFFRNVPVEPDKNTVITAHGNVIIPGLFENPNKQNLKIEQGGMIVLSKNKGEIKVEHAFSQFSNFVRPFYERK